MFYHFLCLNITIWNNGTELIVYDFEEHFESDDIEVKLTAVNNYQTNLIIKYLHWPLVDKVCMMVFGGSSFYNKPVQIHIILHQNWLQEMISLVAKPFWLSGIISNNSISNRPRKTNRKKTASSSITANKWEISFIFFSPCTNSAQGNNFNNWSMVPIPSQRSSPTEMFTFRVIMLKKLLAFAYVVIFGANTFRMSCTNKKQSSPSLYNQQCLHQQNSWHSKQ